MLKSFSIWNIAGHGRVQQVTVEDEGMEVLIKPLQGPHSVLERLGFFKITDVQLEHLGALLAMNTSLKLLKFPYLEKGGTVSHKFLRCLVFINLG